MQCGWLHSGPRLWLRCVHRQVMVTAGKRREEHRGWLLTVDPVSHSVALVSFGEDGASVRVVLGHAVQHVEVLEEPDPDTEERLRSLLPPPEAGGPDSDERRRRRSGVRRWLQQNRVPVEEDGNDLRVARVLTIRAPYRPDDCSSANQIILDRVQRLLRVQPDQVPDSELVLETAPGPDGPVPPGTRDGL
ncbi:gem-associated protein 6-like [Poeciliopsis prolifica]|uniref:gem-associated protein 6-like n=1 Tax=Poeciliopsis prolifica TaxID=188132 RepID=UPI00241454F9|nr:gem-associated protein 6-like [Poeciliopsis prolifica]XP_054881644.1 gem-associated protein 6-like [Poeciliopsis prolifica]XP_054881645.1 gem-associated protein 6-like [Poeciliopsis prolifica]